MVNVMVPPPYVSSTTAHRTPGLVGAARIRVCVPVVTREQICPHIDTVIVPASPGSFSIPGPTPSNALKTSFNALCADMIAFLVKVVWGIPGS